MEFKIPKSLKLELEELQRELVRATKAGGKTGEAAKAVAELLRPHVAKEEEFALPPLGILSALANGGFTPEMEVVANLTEKLKAKHSLLLEEHKAIKAALKKVAAAARAEKKPEVTQLVEKLMFHAKVQEEFFYPASILVGELIKAKSQTQKKGYL